EDFLQLLAGGPAGAGSAGQLRQAQPVLRRDLDVVGTQAEVAAQVERAAGVIARLGGLKSAGAKVTRVPAGLEQVKPVKEHEAHQQHEPQPKEEFGVETFVHEVARIDRAGLSLLFTTNLAMTAEMP